MPDGDDAFEAYIRLKLCARPRKNRALGGRLEWPDVHIVQQVGSLIITRDTPYLVRIWQRSSIQSRLFSYGIMYR